MFPRLNSILLFKSCLSALLGAPIIIVNLSLPSGTFALQIKEARLRPSLDISTFILTLQQLSPYFEPPLCVQLAVCVMAEQLTTYMAEKNMFDNF